MLDTSPSSVVDRLPTAAPLGTNSDTVPVTRTVWPTSGRVPLGRKTNKPSEVAVLPSPAASWM